MLRLTEEALVIEKGQVALRAPTAQAVDYYLSRGFSQEGQRVWREDEIPQNAAPFKPLAIRVLNPAGVISDTLRSVEPVTIEIEYLLDAPITGLRVGIYLLSTRGEYIFTSFDTDAVDQYERYEVRKTGRYVSRCTLPGDFLNEGRFVIGVNASSYRVQRYFHDEQALIFNIDAAGAPGMQWPEPRMGAVRPKLDWQIEGL
ncbi:MAG: Wzt carbohydrate-binding domain-containing protein [Anaerolineaceae bacterium]|nr:Wzt carbohydrate-binding domain-containing protein [Anaerolineaceae bacterium]